MEMIPAASAGTGGSPKLQIPLERYQNIQYTARSIQPPMQIIKFRCSKHFCGCFQESTNHRVGSVVHRGLNFLQSQLLQSSKLTVALRLAQEQCVEHVM